MTEPQIQKVYNVRMMTDEPMTKQRIGIDIDGVIADYTEGLKKWAKTVFEAGFDIEEHCRSYYLTGRGIPGVHGQFVEAGGFRLLEEIPAAASNLRQLQDQGHLLCLITHRNPAANPKAAEDTVWWLHQHAIPYHELHLLGGKGHKGNVLCDCYIDDSPVVIEALRRREKKAVIFDNPYNRHCPGARIKSWSEIYSWLENEAES